MGEIPEWYRWLNAATRLHCSVLDLARDPEGLYWMFRAEAAIEAENIAEKQRAKTK